MSRRCETCHRAEGDTHSQRCSSYWALAAAGRSAKVEPETCYLEHPDGCPLGEFPATVNCDGCIECQERDE